MIKRKWSLSVRHREKLEPEYKCFGSNDSIEDKYDLKYFLLNRDNYSIEYLYKLLSNKYKNLEDYVYKANKQLYYDIVSWTLFQEWINIYINNIYPKYINKFSQYYKIIRTKKLYKQYISNKHTSLDILRM